MSSVADTTKGIEKIMMPIRRAFFAVMAVTAAFAFGAPVAGAATFPAWAAPSFLNGGSAGVNFPGGGDSALAGGACGTPTGGEGQGGTGGTAAQACLGAGLSFIGPAIGQIATVIGPTIIGPAVVGTSIVSAGDAAVNAG
jgi:hypothetical protein